MADETKITPRSSSSEQRWRHQPRRGPPRGHRHHDGGCSPRCAASTCAPSAWSSPPSPSRPPGRSSQRRQEREAPMVQAVDTSYLSIAELAALYRQREVSPVEVTQHLLERALGLQERLHAYITPTPELALAEARQAEAALLRGETASPLLGIPVAYKDIVMTKGIRTTCGSALHLDWVPDQDAAVVEQWRAAGTVMLGKLTTWEFASAPRP